MRWILILGLCLPSVAFGQTPCGEPCTVSVGEPLEIVTEATGATAFLLVVNDEPQAASGVIRGSDVVFSYPSGFQVGDYSLVIDLTKSGQLVSTEPGRLTVEPIVTTHKNNKGRGNNNGRGRGSNK